MLSPWEVLEYYTYSTVWTVYGILGWKQEDIQTRVKYRVKGKSPLETHRSYTHFLYSKT